MDWMPQLVETCSRHFPGYICTQINRYFFQQPHLFAFYFYLDILHYI
jgi:hypothetical protein